MVTSRITAANYKDNYINGLFAEALCRAMLRLQGWRIMASRYRSPRGEIDIIAKRGDIVAVVEVKARVRQDDALAAISARQWQRIHNAANDFLAHNYSLSTCSLRFDVMAVSGTWFRYILPLHIRDAWRPEV